MHFNIYELTPERFEELCFDYIKQIYTGIEYDLYHTQYNHDGGKDIVVKYQDKLHTYKIWAECKQHKDNIGLEEIGKSIILVLNQKINKVILFSASKIRESAKREILTISASHNFDVQFLDGDILFNTLKHFPDILLNYFPDIQINDIEKTDATIDFDSYISEYFDGHEDIDNNNVCYLKYGNLFYLCIFIKNHTNNKYCNIKIKFTKNVSNINIVEKANVPLDFEINPYSDYIFKYLCEGINYYRQIKFPQLQITYEDSNNNYFCQQLDIPIVDFSQYIAYDFRGKEYIEFISNYVNQSIDYTQKGIPQLFNILGKSGTGKTRLLDEIEKRYLKANTSIYRFDCFDFNDYELIKKMVYDLMEVPKSKRNLEFSIDEFNLYADILNINCRCRDILSTYIVKNKDNIFNHSFYEAVSELINYRQKESNKKMLFIIDNIHIMSTLTLNVIKTIIKNFLTERNKITFILSANTDEYRKNIIDYINYFKKMIDKKKQQIFFFECNGFDEKDKMLFWMDVLNRKIPNDKLVVQLMNHVGNKPIELITACNYLKKGGILKKNKINEWNLVKTGDLECFFQTSCREYNNLLNENFKLLFSKFTSSQKNNLYDILSAVVSFKNRMPAFYVTWADLDVSIISILINNNVIKYRQNESCYSFYHDLIYKYCENNPLFNTGRMDNQIMEYMDEYNIFNKDYLLFYIYIRCGNFEKAAELAIPLMKSLKSSYLYSEAIDIGSTIYENPCMEKNIKFYLEAATYYCYCLSQSGNKELSCRIFYSLVKKVLSNQHLLPSERVCEFFRDAVNAHLQCFYFKQAEEILQNYKRVEGLNDKYKFLILNRSGVVNLSLSKFDDAIKDFNTSLIIADQMENGKFWTSTTHSDIALLYFYSEVNEHNRKLCLKEFNDAINDYDKCIDDTRFRKYEILWHKAFLCIMQEDYKKAAYFLDDALNQRYSEIYSVYRLNNLFALVDLRSGRINEAETRLLMVKSLCEVNQYESGLIRVCNNLALIYVLKQNYKWAVEYFELSMQYLNSENLSLKLYPLLTNQYKLALAQNDSAHAKRIQNVIYETKNKRLIEYVNNSEILKNGFTFWNIDGYDYIF